MASPFPGMDPWLERSSIWPDFHQSFCCEISNDMNARLPVGYYARLNHCEAIDQKINFVEIRDSKSNHEIVTLIEILSPTNKLPGSDRRKYIRKREQVMASQTSLIEIDLLRCVGRDVLGDYVANELSTLDRPPEYVVLVQRSWLRSSKWIDCEIFPAPLTRSLPVVAVPLREGEPESTLDLQYAFHQTYTRGPYHRGAIDYTSNPEPRLTEAQSKWATTCLEALKK